MVKEIFYCLGQVDGSNWQKVIGRLQKKLLDFIILLLLSKERELVIGYDGVSDVYPSGIESKDALHELVLVDLGMPIFDNMDLDQLSRQLDILDHKTFMFVANPLKIKELGPN